MSTNNNQYGKEVKPIWKNAAAESQKIMKLSGAKLQSMVSNDLAACTALTLSNRGITKLEDLVGFGDLLHRVDLSCNSITRLQGFNSTPGISMLNVSSNEIAGDASLEDLRYLTELRTLNIGNNTNIKYIRSHVAKPLQKLQGTSLSFSNYKYQYTTNISILSLFDTILLFLLLSLLFIKTNSDTIHHMSSASAHGQMQTIRRHLHSGHILPINISQLCNIMCVAL